MTQEPDIPTSIDPLSDRVNVLYNRLFYSDPILVCSPGRVNLLGEHTDYNQGFVLPAAIDLGAYVGIGKGVGDIISLYSVEYDESFITSLPKITPSFLKWANYILGMVELMRRKGLPIRGFNLVLDGNVPLGAGLSSSAAVECATVFGLNELFQLGLSKLEMAVIAQEAEHEFAQVRCGIMDQFASMFGKRDQLIKLDCRSLEYEYIPFKMDGYKLVLFNTNVKHSLSSSEYNTRRKECETGVQWVKQHCAEVESLRDVDITMLDDFVLKKDRTIYNRCRYVVEENTRLFKGCEDLKNGDIGSLGQKMYSTHEGLRILYEVSCGELDFLVETVKSNPSVLGARMMGGGFGGCTITLVKEEGADELIETTNRAYFKKIGFNPSVYIAKIGEGARLIV